MQYSQGKLVYHHNKKKNANHLFISLIHLSLIFHLYRNQSVDLHCKSIDWFLYDVNIDPIWTNAFSPTLR